MGGRLDEKLSDQLIAYIRANERAVNNLQRGSLTFHIHDFTVMRVEKVESCNVKTEHLATIDIT